MPEPVLTNRLTRAYVQHIKACPEEVFPLLCPEREKEWLPGWDYRMIHSVSGVAEHGAVFETAHAIGAARWIVTEHQAPKRVAFARWQPDGVMVQIEIMLGRHSDGTTAVCIEYTWTPTDDASRAILAAAGEKDWLENMAHWEGSMNEWFRDRPRATASR